MVLGVLGQILMIFEFFVKKYEKMKIASVF